MPNVSTLQTCMTTVAVKCQEVSYSKKKKAVWRYQSPAGKMLKLKNSKGGFFPPINEIMG